MPSSAALDEVRSLKQQMDPLKALLDTGSCPTCKRPYTDVPQNKDEFYKQYR